MEKEPKGVVLYDGVCNLCSGFVRFIISHDKRSFFLFKPLQTIKDFREDNQQTAFSNTVVLIENGIEYRKSTAALRIIRKLDGWIKICYLFIVVPVFIRDFVYDFIAKRRYLFGAKQNCELPGDHLKERFVS